MEDKKLSSLELLESCKVYSENLGMDVVPYSIALQVIALEKTNNLLNNLPKLLGEAQKLEKQIKATLKK